MTNREKFIEEVSAIQLSEEAQAYFEIIKNIKEKEKIVITETGAKIVSVMREINEPVTTKVIAEILEMGGRAVSGASRKLITEGFIEKVKNDPVTYALTEKGKTYDLTV